LHHAEPAVRPARCVGMLRRGRDGRAPARVFGARDPRVAPRRRVRARRLLFRRARLVRALSGVDHGGPRSVARCASGGGRQAHRGYGAPARIPRIARGGDEARRIDAQGDSLSRGKRVLMLVENLPSPFDRRVWQEATTLRAAGCGVSIICPTGPGCRRKFELIDGIEIHRYDLPLEAAGALGYAAEYAIALAWTFVLACKVYFTRGFDAIHACNPPDLFFLVAALFKPLGVKFLFDHHDLNPELFEAKFGRRGFLWKVIVWVEKLTFKTADVSIATNESYRRIALTRGGMDPGKVFVVRSGPSLERMKIVPPSPKKRKY